MLRTLHNTVGAWRGHAALGGSVVVRARLGVEVRYSVFHALARCHSSNASAQLLGLHRWRSLDHTKQTQAKT